MPNTTPTVELHSAAAASENQVVVDAATRAAGPKIVELYPETVYAYRRDDPIERLDLEQLLPSPRRKRGHVQLHRAASLSQYVNVHQAEGTELFADEATGVVVAVFNDHAPHEAGWGDHRATLRLRNTPAWKRWTDLDGTIGDQETFAEHVEISILDIVSPSGADMLELAQSIHATKSSIFKSDKRLANGQVQVQYEETLAASAGAQRQLDIPTIFTLAIAPFEGNDLVEITARLRYRLVQGQLRIGYQLDRPDEVLRAAFTDVVEAIEKDTILSALHGNPRGV